MTLQHLFACLIFRPGGEVDWAINFHHKRFFRADEIHDETIHRMLAAELQPMKPPIPKLFPNQFLGWCGITAHAPSRRV